MLSVGSALALGPVLDTETDQQAFLVGVSRDGPLPTPTLTPTPTATATPTATPTAEAITSWPRVLNESQMRSLYAQAGVPSDWVEPMLTIAWCESRYTTDALGDSSGSLGIHQLWSGWFSRAGYATSQWSDPVVNTKVALYVREELGRFGGSGGWTCANMNGIH